MSWNILPFYLVLNCFIDLKNKLKPLKNINIRKKYFDLKIHIKEL